MRLQIAGGVTTMKPKHMMISVSHGVCVLTERRIFKFKV